MENLDRTDMLTAGTKGNVEPMMKMTIESTEQAWNKNVECQETLEKSGKSRVHNAADGNREPALWSECTHARRNWKNALTEWSEAERNMEESEKAFMILGKNQEHVRQTWEHENSKIPKETMARQPMNTNVGAIHPGTSKCRAALMELWKESKQEARRQEART